MADVSKIQLPSGSEYNIKDEVARTQIITSIYTSETKNLRLGLSSAINVENEEFQEVYYELWYCRYTISK